VDYLSTRPHGLDGLDPTVLAALAQLLADAVLRTADTTPTPTGPHPHPNSWAELHQATGIVMATLGLSTLDALDLLRARAFTIGQLLHDLATTITTSHEPMPHNDHPS